jgi:RHS repeat-associated protein
VNGNTTIFVTDADNREILEYDGTSGAIKNWYAYGLGPNDVLNQMNVAAATRATLIPDVQGSIVGTLDATSGTLTKVGYRPYGESSSTSGSFRYTAQRIDPETNGLYYYRARQYIPAWGRFMQPDPIGYSGGNNLYAYVYNDPINGTDASGLYAGVDDAAFAGVGAVIGVSTVGIFDLARSAYNGQWIFSSKGTYASAAITGTATGLGILYAPATGGVSFVAAAAGGAALGNIAQQGIESGFAKFSYSSFAVDVGTSTALSLIPIPHLSGIPGVTAGQNSLAAIGRSTITKFENETISNVTTQTAIEGAVGLGIYDLPGTIAEKAAGVAADYGYGQLELSSGAKK